MLDKAVKSKRYLWHKFMEEWPIMPNQNFGSGFQKNKIPDFDPYTMLTKRKEMEICYQEQRDFYYIDTGYFGNGRKKIYHRITKNALQNLGPIIDRPGDRFETTGVQLRKFRPGTNILLAPPSQKLLNIFCKCAT